MIKNSLSSGPKALSTAALQRVRLFASLHKATVAHIAGYARVQSYVRNEHILLQGDPARAVYFIVTGEVRVYRVSREGREQVLVHLLAGQTFNTVPAFRDGGRNPANVVAIDEVTLGAVLKQDFLDLVAGHSDLALAVLEDFADHLTTLTDLVEGLALHTVQERLARFLLDRAETEAPAGEMAAQRWTQQEIAIHLGTVRDVVGRELRAMEDAGLVRIERGRIVLLDRQKLVAIADRTDNTAESVNKGRA